MRARSRYFCRASGVNYELDIDWNGGGGGGGSIDHDFPLIQTNGCAPIDKNLSE